MGSSPPIPDSSEECGDPRGVGSPGLHYPRISINSLLLKQRKTWEMAPDAPLCQLRVEVELKEQQGQRQPRIFCCWSCSLGKSARKPIPNAPTSSGLSGIAAPG